MGRARAVLAAVLVVAACGMVEGQAGATGTTYYLNQATGSDANSGTSTSAPWETIDHAVSQLACGDTLVVYGTEAHPYVPAGSPPVLTWAPPSTCTATSPITIRAAATKDPTISGRVVLKNPKHVTFDDIDVRWNQADTSTDHMVVVRGGTGWTWQNSELYESEGFANLLVAPCTSTTCGGVTNVPVDWTVSDNCIHTNNSNDTDPDRNRSHLVYVGAIAGSTGGAITGNILFSTDQGHGIKLDGPNGVDSPTGVTVAYNTIDDVNAGTVSSPKGHGLIVGNDAEDNVFDHNLVTNSLGSGALRSFEIDSQAIADTNTLSDTAYYRTSAANNRLQRSDGSYAIPVSGSYTGADPWSATTTGSCAGYTPTSAYAAYGARA
jgi:hypothetical protein